MTDTNEARLAEIRARDWTMDGDRTNSSALFLRLVREVERLIRSSAHELISGRADQTARLIVAQLAHVHGLAPIDDQNRALQERVEALEAALTFYADPHIYAHENDDCSVACEDSGDKAQAALAPKERTHG